MVIEKRGNTVFYPKACTAMMGIEKRILSILSSHDINGRMMFPITSPLELFDTNYNDISKEYLVDFSNMEDKITVFNPEYYTVIKDYNEKYLHAIKDYKFYYIQQTLSYTSVERVNIKEDSIIGFCHLNGDNSADSWVEFTDIFTDICREMESKNYSVEYSSSYTVTAKIDGITIGFARRNLINNIMEAHFSVTDIYEVLNRMKKI